VELEWTVGDMQNIGVETPYLKHERKDDRRITKGWRGWEAVGNGSGSRKAAGFVVISIGSSAPITRLLLLSDVFISAMVPSRVMRGERED
jgi:hypothetical protein